MLLCVEDIGKKFEDLKLLKTIEKEKDHLDSASKKGYSAWHDLYLKELYTRTRWAHRAYVKALRQTRQTDRSATSNTSPLALKCFKSFMCLRGSLNQTSMSERQKIHP